MILSHFIHQHSHNSNDITTLAVHLAVSIVLITHTAADKNSQIYWYAEALGMSAILTTKWHFISSQQGLPVVCVALVTCWCMFCTGSTGQLYAVTVCWHSVDVCVCVIYRKHKATLCWAWGMWLPPVLACVTLTSDQWVLQLHFLSSLCARCYVSA